MSAADFGSRYGPEPANINGVASVLRQDPLHCDGDPELLSTENESNAQRLWRQPNVSPYVKDACHAYGIAGQAEAVNPAGTETKAAAHYVPDVPDGRSMAVRLRLAAGAVNDPLGDFEQTFANRIADADEFCARIASWSLTEDQRRVHRQALADMLWSKQFHYFDLPAPLPVLSMLEGSAAAPFPWLRKAYATGRRRGVSRLRRTRARPSATHRASFRSTGETHA